MGFFSLFFHRSCWNGLMVPVFQTATLTLTRCCVTASRATNKGGTTCTTSAENPLGTMHCLTAGVDMFWGLCFLLWLWVDGSMQGGGESNIQNRTVIVLFSDRPANLFHLSWDLHCWLGIKCLEFCFQTAQQTCFTFDMTVTVDWALNIHNQSVVFLFSDHPAKHTHWM